MHILQDLAWTMRAKAVSCLPSGHRQPRSLAEGNGTPMHHQHHWGSFSPILTSHAPNVFLSRTPRGALGLVFKTARAHDADFGGSRGSQKSFKNPSVPWGFAVGAAAQPCREVVRSWFGPSLLSLKYLQLLPSHAGGDGGG